MIGVIDTGSPAPSLFLEIFAGVAVLGCGAFFAFVARKFKVIDSMYDALVTRKPSELESQPPLGFIDQLKENTRETKDNKEAVLAMATRFGQQNGTVLDIQTDVASLHTAVEKIEKAVSEIAGKPPASVAEVKEAVAHEHEASEARQAQILGAIKKDTTSLVEDSHPDGGDSSRDVLDRIDVATQSDEPLES
jgi:hypothetical protein